MKKIISVILSVCIVLTLFISQVSAESERRVVLAFPDFYECSDSVFALTDSSLEDGVLKLTPSMGSYGSSAYYASRIELGAQRSFSTFFTFNITPDDGASDGFIFNLNSDRAVLSHTYGCMGISLSEDSFGIEFDTYQNTEYSDVSSNHIALVKGTAGGASPVKQLDLNSAGILLSDGATKYAWIDYDGESDILTVYVSNTVKRSDGACLSVEQAGLKNILVGSRVYAGFTTTVYGSGKQHDITSWYFDNSFSPIETEKYACTATHKNIRSSLYLNTDAAHAEFKVTDSFGKSLSGEDIYLKTSDGLLAENRVITGEDGKASAEISGITAKEIILTSSLESGEYTSASAFAFSDFGNEYAEQSISLWGLSDSNPGYESYDVRPEISDGKIRLNNKKWNPGYGAAYYASPLLLKSDMSFSTAFTFDIEGSQDRGFAFVLTNNDTVAQNLNYDDTDRNIGMPLYGRSVMIEFDMRRDSGEGDSSAKHIGFTVSADNRLTYRDTLDLKSTYFADGQVKYAWIDYDGEADTLYVTVGETAVRENGETLTVNGAGICGVLSGREVYAGFVTTIYDTDTRHNIDSWYLNSDYMPVSLPAEYLIGDINGDGALNSLDIAEYRKILLNIRELESGEIEHADLNADGVINILDMIILKKAVAQINNIHINEGKALDTMYEAIRSSIANSPASDNYFRFSISKNGQERDCYFKNMSACTNIYSVSKAVTSTAVGLAYDRGMIGLDDPILNYLGDHAPENYDPKLEKVTVRHLLTHTSGIAQGGLFENDRYTGSDKDWIARMLGRELVYEPGTVFTYDNGHFYLLACIIEKVSGMSLDNFLQVNLFDALDIHEYAWERCPMGHVMGATGLYFRIDDMNKLGQLYANDGIYQGKRLLSSEWIAMASAPYPNTSGVKYGFGFTIGENGDFFCAGAHNQLLYISPENKTAVAVQGFDDSGTVVLDYIVRDAIWN